MTSWTRRGALALSAGLAGLGGSRAQSLAEVTVGGVQLPTDAPLFIAMEKNYFAAEGIKVKITWFQAAASVFSAVVSRDVDLGITAITAATFNLAARGGFKIVAGTTRDRPGLHINAVLISNKAFEAGFTTFADMAGKRIAITTAGSTHQYYIALLAKKYGIDLKGIVEVPLESYANITAALQSGQVDAAILPPTTARRLVGAGGAHLLGWTGDEVQYQQGVVVASPQTLAAKHDLIAGFLRAFARGAAEFNANFDQLGPDGRPVRGPDYDTLAPIVARGAGIQPAELEGQIAYIDPQARFDEDDIARQIAFWQAQGLVTKGADFSTLFDTSFR